MNILIELVFDGVRMALVNLEQKMLIQSVINLRRFYFIIEFIFDSLKYFIKIKKNKKE